MVAMVSRDESDATPPIIEALRATVEFQRAALIVTESLANDDQWASQVLSEYWSDESFAIIRSTLGTWFANIA